MLNVASIPILGFIAGRFFHNPDEEEIIKNAKLQTSDGKINNITILYKKREHSKNSYIIEPPKNNFCITISVFSKEHESLEIKGEVSYAIVKEILGANILMENDPLKYQDVLIEFQMKNKERFEIKTQYFAKENDDIILEIYDNNGIVSQSGKNYIQDVKVITKNIFKNIHDMNMSIDKLNSKISIEEQASKIVDEALSDIVKDSREFLSARMIAIQQLSKNITDSLEEEKQEKIVVYQEQIMDKIQDEDIEKIFTETTAENIEIRVSIAATKVVNNAVEKIETNKKNNEFIKAKENLIITISENLILKANNS